jgi:hypothetical protein
MLIDGVMLLWFLLTALSVAFVAIDIRNTPEHPVMKWAFVLFTLYSGRSVLAAVLVPHVACADVWSHHRLSDELVAGRPSPEARHDDGSAEDGHQQYA